MGKNKKTSCRHPELPTHYTASKGDQDLVSPYSFPVCSFFFPLGGRGENGFGTYIRDRESNAKERYIITLVETRPARLLQGKELRANWVSILAKLKPHVSQCLMEVKAAETAESGI
ncbi:hypothetical protein Pint_08387 [Pistacia integerrima]|uniref:Uncharacterized protein n=1 Tax=Pistacia integerrima TaxID=434235 RepID=A0ACC0XYM3_9ROSI|nr:hypothetical protein Pint_08387 [Pistacia integerrima]